MSLTWVSVSYAFHVALSLWNRLTIRQTRDPYVDDVQYIAYSKQTFADCDNAGLILNNLGLGQPGDYFYVCHTPLVFPSIQVSCR